MTALWRGAVAAATIWSLSAVSAAAQSYRDFVLEANQNTVTIVSGAPGETSLEIAHDLSTVLHCVDGLRIVPMAGRGDANNIYDLLFMKGVDMAIVRADVLDHLSDTQTYIKDLKNRVRYVATLFEQEVHLIAGADVASVEDLDGKLVNIGATGQLALAARRILSAAGVKVRESKFDNTLALERVIDGGLDAMFITGGKPIPLLNQIGMVAGLKLVPIEPIQGETVYGSATFEHDDYPALVKAGESVPTVSVPSVLAVYNWPTENDRYAKNALFTRALFRRSAYLNRPARHPKWASANLADQIEGWRRIPIAEELAQSRSGAVRRAATAAAAEPAPSAEQLAAAEAEKELREAFTTQLEEFGITPQNDEEREELFAAFKRRMAAQSR